MTSPSAPDTQLSLAIDPARPYARLTLGSHVHSGYDLRSGRMQSISRHRAALAFIYAGEAVSGRPGSEPREAQRRIERRPAHEQEYRETLRRLGFKPATRRSDALEESAGEMFELPGDNAWLHFMQDDLPRLRQQGWFIDIRADFAYDLTPIDAWYAEVEEADDRQWFELELGIQVAGQRVSLLPALTELIRRSPALLDPRALARHADEEQLVLRLELNPPLRVALPFGRLKPVLAALSDFYLGDPEPQRKLRLGAPDAARLADLDELPLAWEGGDNLRDFARRLRSFQARPATPPQGLRAELRPYQLEGLSWMQTLRELDSGGVLADDMGLGKTLQSLAHVLLEKQAGRLDTPALVVMPTSLIPNWLDEAERFAPDLRVLALHGTGRRRDFARIDEHDLVLTTYALLPRDAAELGKRRFHLLILDEAQNIKNATTKAAVAARELAARHRLCLTGTPLENHLGELWSLFHFLMPGWLGDARQFAQDYRTPIEKHGDEARLSHLAARLRPFLLRRTKEQVASELPPKSEFTQFVELSEAQRELYETVRLALDRKVREEIARRGLARSRIVILEALLKLRQVCCDTRLLQRHEDGAQRPGAQLGQAGLPARHARRTDRRGSPGPVVLAVHLDARADRGRPAPARRRLRPADRRDPRPPRPGTALPERQGAGVPDQLEGRRGRPQPDRGGHRDPLRSLVEPGGGEPGQRPRLPHRPGQAGVRLPADRPRHGGREDPAPAAGKGRPRRRPVQRRQRRRLEARRGRYRRAVRALAQGALRAARIQRATPR